MFKGQKTIGALAGMALMGMSASASAVTVLGITWDPDSLVDFSAQQSVYENFVSSVGDTLTFYGIVNQINGVSNFTSPGRELTFFGQYTVSQVLDVDADPYPDYVLFNNGTLSIYSDDSPDFNFMNPATAQDGDLFLSLSGHDNTINIAGTNYVAELFGNIVSGELGTGNAGGSGAGLWDVIGGAAMAYFDTNTIADSNTPGGFADFRYSTSFQENNVIVTGTAEMFGDSIPEPTTTALLGAGLLGLGVFRRRKRL